MQRDIIENGPVMIGLMVYEDLYNYESGIYEYTAGQLVGGHAIRAIGWGHDDDGLCAIFCILAGGKAHECLRETVVPHAEIRRHEAQSQERC